MGKIRPGNKLNSYLNGEWAAHFRHRSITSGLRRAWDKEVTRKEAEYAFTYEIPGHIPGFFEDDSLRYAHYDYNWLHEIDGESYLPDTKKLPTRKERRKLKRKARMKSLKHAQEKVEQRMRHFSDYRNVRRSLEFMGNCFTLQRLNKKLASA